jgi:putative ABC transport system ATP-binding protein
MPDLDVWENVALPLLFDDEPLDARGSRARVEAALARLGIDALGAALPDELSGGQAQRVAVARVLVCRPRLMLADEPTGQLDDEAAHLVMAALLDTADDLGAALVVATHDPRIADRLDEQWPMRDGRLDPGDGTRPDAARTASASRDACDPR